MVERTTDEIDDEKTATEKGLLLLQEVINVRQARILRLDKAIIRLDEKKKDERQAIREDNLAIKKKEVLLKQLDREYWHTRKGRAL